MQLPYEHKHDGSLKKLIKFNCTKKNPTRIEVKLDDLEEFNQMKKDKELEQAKQKLGSNDWHTPTQDSLMDTRTITEFIHES
jgi:ABC-type lipoprotein release transport system permease subunit